MHKTLTIINIEFYLFNLGIFSNFANPNYKSTTIDADKICMINFNKFTDKEWIVAAKFWKNNPTSGAGYKLVGKIIEKHFHFETITTRS